MIAGKEVIELDDCQGMGGRKREDVIDMCGDEETGGEKNCQGCVQEEKEEKLKKMSLEEIRNARLKRFAEGT